MFLVDMLMRCPEIHHLTYDQGRCYSYLDSRRGSHNDSSEA